MRAAASYPERRRSPLMAVLSLLTLMVLAPVAQAQFKTERPPYPDFLNYGKKKFTKPGIELENEIIKSKVEVLGEILKSHVHQLRQAPGQRVELVFLVDASASVGAENFFNEIKFVKKLLADFAVSYNQTRVAVITFSSKSKVIRHIDHVTQASADNHKCTLLETELPRIKYSGGGTYTLGAMLEAQSVLALARNNARKAVFLVTDGYSNGGDPRPAAAFLQARGVTIFTFGIRNGNVKELYDMASVPKEEHSYILDTFEEFEALARRALHEDLHSGVLIHQPPRTCGKLCEEGTYCCDADAACTCDTHTGHYACTCRKGYYGTGILGDCRPCPPGTYRTHQGPGDVSSCSPCPDPHMVSDSASTSPQQCYCKLGFKQVGQECLMLQCPVLAPPENGYFVRSTCNNVVNAACGVRCKPGYTLKGSSIRMCGKNGEWTGWNTQCVMKSCPKLKPMAHGTMVCTQSTPIMDTECHFTCDPGYQLVGSKMRTCLPVAMWDGIPAYCKPIFCPRLPPLQNGRIRPGSCSSSKSKYGSRCEFACDSGYQISGPIKTTCIDPGVWSEGHKSPRCVDVTPPVIQCPENITTATELHEAYANVTWNPPHVKDNSKGKIKLHTVPATSQPMKMKIGNHTITYVAMDKLGNKASCEFYVTVVDKDPPRIDECLSPPVFLSHEEVVDVYWEEPVFSDNSGGEVKITRSRDPGQFPQGDTMVEYWAEDAAGNVATCNITITVQKHACQMPVDPINGAANCTENPDAVFCTLTCDDSYAFAMRPQQDYFCAYDGIWLPDDNPMPFPDCSVTSVSNSISQYGEMAMGEEDDSICDDIFFMGQVENQLEKKLEDALTAMCSDDVVCEVAAVEAVCESILADAEEEFNSIGFFRRRRSAEDEALNRYWPGRHSEEGWVYWQREAPGQRIKRDTLLREFDALDDIQRRKRQFGLTIQQLLGEKTTTQAPATANSRSENYLGVLIDLISKSLASDVSIVQFNSFLTKLSPQEGDFTTNDFLQAFSEEFGEDKTKRLRELAGKQLSGMKIPGLLPRDETPAKNRTARDNDSDPFPSVPSDEISSNDYGSSSIIFPGHLEPTAPAGPGAKKTFKIRFTVEGHGSGAKDQIGGAMDGLLKAAGDGQLDVNFGQRQLHVAAIRLKENPDYICEPGSVSQGDKCVKCPVGTFFNVVLKECQPCPKGSFQPEEGQVSCIVCPSNTSTKVNSAKSGQDCKAQCLPGSFSDDGLEPCVTCDLGQYQDEYASLSCASCPHNTTTWRRGCWVIEECQPSCAPGSVSETGLQPCFDCPVGFFQEQSGQTECFRCPHGAGTDGLGATSIFQCHGVTEGDQAAHTNLDTLSINDCFSTPCLNGGSCSPLDLGYVCQCVPGYSGQHCESEIDECESDPCFNEGTCVDMLDGFHCECPPGFTGPQCEVDINECDPDPCQNGATCADLTDSFKCVCQSGYTGEVCDMDIDECAAKPCAEGATCEDRLNDVVCVCPPGVTGRFCETPIDECESSPCEHGFCIDQVNSFNCVCEPGFEGDTCAINTDDCASAPCQNGGTCTDWVNGFSCECSPGYTGTNCETEMSTDFVLEFPTSGILDYAAIEKVPRPMNSSSVCFWMKTDDRDNYGTPFSYATDSHDNAFTITDYSGFVLYVNGDKRITDVGANDGQWHFVCVTWKSLNGTWTIYLDGQLADSGTGLAPNTTIEASGTLVLGQEQDQRGGSYSPQESFRGEITLVNLWAKELSLIDVLRTFSRCDRYVGDVTGWPDFQAGIKGQVKTKPSTFCHGCGVPSKPSDGQVRVNGAGAGAVATVECDQGFKLYTGESERTCLVYGMWSGPEPECRRVTCGFPGYLLNGHVEGSSYSFGDTVSYTCNPGFVLQGASTRTCQDDGVWTGEHPECEVIKCPNLQAGPNGQVTSYLGNYMPTNQISFSCEEGYLMDGPAVLTCGGDGEWDGNPPACQSKACGQLPSIVNGYVEGGAVVRPGEQVEVKCNAGYKLHGDPMVTCKDDFTWSLPLPKCKVPKCDKPPAVLNGRVKVRASASSREAVYICDPGFVVVGDKVLRCGAEGEWSGPWSTCEALPCPKPTVPAHAITPEKDVWRVGDLLSYECELGYLLQGSSLMECVENGVEGEWNGVVPQCVIATCPPPIKPENGIVSVVHRPPNPSADLNRPVLPSVSGEIEFRRKRSLDFPEFPSIGQSNYDDDPDWLPEDYDYSLSHGTGQSSIDSSITDYDHTGQKLGGSEFSQSTGQSSNYEDFGQQTGGFEFSQSTGQSSNYEDFGQQTGGFEFSQSTGQSSNYEDFGQQSGFQIGTGQSSIDFDYIGQNTGQTFISYDDLSQSNTQQSADGLNLVQQSDYVYGAEVEYDCSLGYKLLGARKRHCMETGDWDSPEPRCYEQFCSELLAVQNGYIVYHGSGVNSRAEYICNPGYNLVGVDFELLCQIDKTWLGEIPTCEIMDCGEPPDIGNGTVAFTATTYGSLASYDCFFGYVIEGSFERFCGPYGFWNGSMPRCIAVTCNVPEVIENGYITFDGNLYVGSPIEYECKVCYKLNGTRFRTCQVDGTWTLEEPTCDRIYCSEIPDSIPNGRAIGDDNACGSLVEYECSPGYRRNGRRNATCLESGKWSSEIPTCERISCGPPPLLANGNHIGQSYDFTDKITFECDEGYIMTGHKLRVCQADGTWSESSPVCSIVNCTKPQGPSNGKVRLSGLFFGAYAEVVCDPGFTLTGDKDLMCGADGNWNKEMPHCLPVICPPAPQSPYATYNSSERQFEAFTVLKYTCDNGYHSAGPNDILTCGASGEWEGDVIQCQPVNCGDPGTLPNGYIGGSNYTFGGVVTFTCDPGYKLLGVPTADCLADGSWSNYVTSCIQIICPSPLQVAYGKIVSGGSDSSFGATLKYECDPGYIMTGDATRTCTVDGFWTGDDPECRPVTCPEPFEAMNAEVEGDVFEFGHSIKYKCMEGFTMQGEAELTCKEDGTWSEAIPVCEMVTCSTIPDIQHGRWELRSLGEVPIKTEPITAKGHAKGRAKGHGKAAKSAKLQELLQNAGEEGIVHKFGDLVEFECDPGYAMTTSSLLECTERGWSAPVPQCHPIICPIPIQIRQGSISGSDYTFGSTITYTCDEGYELVGENIRTCQENKEWSGTEPFCKEIECPRPAPLDDGQTIGSDITYQSILSYVCDPGFKLEGVKTRTCGSDGHWTDEQPACVEVFCSIPDEVAHGTRNIISLRVGGTVRYTCMEGYRMEGAATLNCANDGVWDAATPRCVQVDCGPAPSAPFVVSHGDHTVYDSKVTFGCERGYRAEGPEWTTCLQSGSWSNEAPDCLLIECPPPSAPSHGRVLSRGQDDDDDDDSAEEREIEEMLPVAPRKGGTKTRKTKKGRKGRGQAPARLVAPQAYRVDDVVTWVCDEGFSASGGTNATCGEDGKWSSTPPRCRRIFCGIPTLPDYANIKGDDFLYGANVTYSCREGYELKGESVLTCDANGKWSSEAPSCQPVSCGQPALTTHTRVNYILPEHNQPHSFGSTASYYCLEGYELIGAQYQVCEVNGEWVGGSHTCVERLCEESPNLSFGVVTRDDKSRPQAAYFSCLPGYNIVGDSYVTCSMGQWQDYNTTCQPVNCYEPEIPSYGKITAKHFTFGSVANYSCVYGYMLLGNPSVVCDADGTWKGALPVCQPVDCGVPEAPANGQVESTFTDLGAEALYHCDTGFELFGNDTRTCTADASWSGNLPQCHRLDCGEVKPPPMGFVMGASTLYGDRVKFGCEKGYFLRGQAKAICNESGVWSAQVPTCEPVRCVDPVVPPNAEVPPSAPSAYVYQERVHFRCKEGHLMRGKLSSTCLETSQWSPVSGQCSRISCGRPKVKEGGVVVRGRYYYQDRVVYRCPSGKVPNGTKVLTCKADGTWSGAAACVKKCAKRCLNGGICLNNNICSCPPGYQGDRCQHAKCPLPCLHGGVCTGPHRCTCIPGYAGPRCETYVCESGCGERGKCIGPNVCHCDRGYTGPACDTEDYDYYRG
ncbi:sushi, von Willebrand factor type A, EGF and pentraxin domain-containing protein 1-like isoform X2 [Penaeus japonicus]|uniref:sushi, von Willebrand factor type A, EGF and pentraxin domain-containing protein 1-like isoform X2 n=1 Tax=Penaeus japonicus TaxID=27405 RepID=UPI001C70C25F|nr:sushi, von Willebrand factor type A, EGF and pentraxin domain-containing protein 1-like isoform X2 [Penaeus japonicus]